MQQQANQHRQDRVFEVGTWVYLKLQPYRQTSLRVHHSQNFAKRYFGPFQILRRIGQVAYELDLPPSARIHPIFHISLLKPCYGNPPFPTTSLPPSLFEDPTTPQPLQILGHRSLPTANGTKQQLLVQWHQQSERDATWEDLSQFRSTYRQFALEDKGNDTSSGSTYMDLGPSHDEEPINSIDTRPKRKTTRPAWLKDFE